ncbi:hypothetical protein HUG15_15310 [Salicibibacter cibarius]|uniref:Uncharacterized protein n=1 Tax=Salicibibacter cibarius TaxID=2743000 RepID=A0A7T6Z4S7_9BACI|nr:hypothetical protein [Salicibibacter cibarius]QQK76793.1 hypothetical protein HUG15_15310 [Salicibibacter cibarius]
MKNTSDHKRQDHLSFDNRGHPKRQKNGDSHYEGDQGIVKKEKNEHESCLVHIAFCVRSSIFKTNDLSAKGDKSFDPASDTFQKSFLYK